MTTILASRIGEMRKARGLSQRALAEAAGVTRQAIGAIEAGRMQPSVGIALGLARALGTTVEELFSAPADGVSPVSRTATATIGGRTVTHALDHDHLAIEPSASPYPTAFIAGCDVSAGLLSRYAMLRTHDVRVIWLPMTNRASISALERGEVHAAVIHGEATMHSDRFEYFELAKTEEGWLVDRGNPLHFRGAADLLRSQMRVVNRPAGAQARTLLDEQLRRGRVDPDRLPGYHHTVSGQLDAGRAIAQGFADAAIGMASVAQLYKLDFIPLREERCTLVVASDTSRTPEIRGLLDALRSAQYRRDLEALRSYDTTRTGERIA